MNSTTLPKELIIMGKQELDKEKFKEIRNKEFIKSEGGYGLVLIYLIITMFLLGMNGVKITWIIGLAKIA